MSLINKDCGGFVIDDNYENESWDWSIPFGCNFCSDTEHTPVEPLVPIEEEKDPKEGICPPGFKNPWDLGEAPDYDGEVCEGEGMDCVCNPMAISTGIPCYTTIFVTELPQEGMNGIMYVVPEGDKYGVYMWNGASWDSVTPVPILQSKTVSPSTSAQDVAPDTGYDGLSDVHVDAMPDGTLNFPSYRYYENLGMGMLELQSTVDVDGYVDTSDNMVANVRCQDILPTENAKTVTPTTSEQVAVDANKWTRGQIKVAAMPTAVYGAQSIQYEERSGHAFLEVNDNLITPGYVDFPQGVNIDLDDYLPEQPAIDIDPTESIQIAVPKWRWTTGPVRFGPIPPQYIVPTGTLPITANGNDIDVAQYEKVNVNVAASGKAVQIDNTNHRIASTSYVDTGAKITVTKAGTYTVYYSAFRSSTSGTSGTQLYKNGVAQGTVNTTWENSYCQTPHTTMTLAVDDVIKVYARSRSASYYTCVANLTIIEQ